MGRLGVRAVGVIAWVAASTATVLLALAFLPTLFGLRALVVASGSMGRAVPMGGVALTRAVEAQAITVGDVITFRYRGDGETITHRVIAVERQPGQFVFTTKGDANKAVDPERVTVALRVHKVMYAVPLAGYVIRYTRTPLGGVALILVPILGLLVERRKREARPSRVARSVRRARSRQPRTGEAVEAGWSTTTYHLVRVSPRGLRSDPGG